MKRALRATGLVAVLLIAAGLEFLALLHHPGWIWIVVPLATVALCAYVWLRSEPLLSPRPLGGMTFIGLGLSLHLLMWGAPGLAALYFAIGGAIGLLASAATRGLRSAI